jgi:hypothetical protein
MSAFRAGVAVTGTTRGVAGLAWGASGLSIAIVRGTIPGSRW